MLSPPHRAREGLPGVTPAIISQELFDHAQKQLQANREKSLRNCKHDYLLRGHIRCRQCGRVYTGEFTGSRFYKCIGRKKAYAPVERCQNKGWKADALKEVTFEGRLSSETIDMAKLAKQFMTNIKKDESK
jgi:site-specific DNA recombinase